MTKNEVFVKDTMTGADLYLEPKSFLRGGMRGDDPTVVLVIRSFEGMQVLGGFELTPDSAQVLAEHLGSEARLASVIQKDNEDI